MKNQTMSDFNRSKTVNLHSFNNSHSIWNISVNSPKLIRPIGIETCDPFTFIPNAKIPDLSESRREEQEERR